jgi:hypothetical protein
MKQPIAEDSTRQELQTSGIFITAEQEAHSRRKVTEVSCYVLLLIIFLVPIVTRHSAINAAKMLVAELMLIFGAVSFWIFFLRHQHFTKLRYMEENAGQIRDEAVMYFTEGRAVLHQLTEKLDPNSKETAFALPKFLKTIGPIMTFFLSKEKTMMHWGMFGLKIAKNLFNAYKSRKQ